MLKISEADSNESPLKLFIILFSNDVYNDEIRKGGGKCPNFRPNSDFFGDWAVIFFFFFFFFFF